MEFLNESSGISGLAVVMIFGAIILLISGAVVVYRKKRAGGPLLQDRIGCVAIFAALFMAALFIWIGLAEGNVLETGIPNKNHRVIVVLGSGMVGGLAWALIISGLRARSLAHITVIPMGGLVAATVVACVFITHTLGTVWGAASFAVLVLFILFLFVASDRSWKKANGGNASPDDSDEDADDGTGHTSFIKVTGIKRWRGLNIGLAVAVALMMGALVIGGAVDHGRFMWWHLGALAGAIIAAGFLAPTFVEGKRKLGRYLAAFLGAVLHAEVVMFLAVVVAPGRAIHYFFFAAASALLIGLLGLGLVLLIWRMRGNRVKAKNWVWTTILFVVTALSFYLWGNVVTMEGPFAFLDVAVIVAASACAVVLLWWISGWVHVRPAWMKYPVFLFAVTALAGGGVQLLHKTPSQRAAEAAREQATASLNEVRARLQQLQPNAVSPEAADAEGWAHTAPDAGPAPVGIIQPSAAEPKRCDEHSDCSTDQHCVEGLCTELQCEVRAGKVALKQDHDCVYKDEHRHAPPANDPPVEEPECQLNGDCLVTQRCNTTSGECEAVPCSHKSENGVAVVRNHKCHRYCRVFDGYRLILETDTQCDYEQMAAKPPPTREEAERSKRKAAKKRAKAKRKKKSGRKKACKRRCDDNIACMLKCLNK